MRKLLLLGALLSCWMGMHAQGLVPKPIPCTEPKVYTPGFIPGSMPVLDFEGYNCVDLYGPIPAGGPNVIEKGHTDIVAGRYVHFGPGVHIGPMVDSVPPYTPGHYMHAYIGTNDFDVVWFEPNSTPGEVGQFEKLELGVKLPTELQTRVNNYINGTGSNPLNPFDPDSIKIQADFYALGDGAYIGSTPITKTVYGFYYKEYVRNLSTHGWDQDTTSYSFRIRYAPKELGNYLVKIQVITSSSVLNVLPVSFTCIASDNKGYITYDSTTTTERRKFLYHSGTNEPFFAIGNNLNWTDTGALYYQLESDDYYQMSHWMNTMADYGANFTRISMIPYQYGLEWTDGGYNKLNNYSSRMTNAWEFDQILKLAESRGLYIDIHNEIHDNFQTEADMISAGSDHHPNTTWDRNPYNSNNQNIISGINTPLDFINSISGRNCYKKKLRYIVSRWGYSPNIMIWELVSEIDGMLSSYNTDESTRADFYNWFSEMRNYLKNDLRVDQMISGSYAKEALNNYLQKIWALSDVMILHEYRTRTFENYDTKWEDVKNAQIYFGNIPVIIGEQGDNAGPGLVDCSQYFFHNDTWATAFMGTFGNGQGWNWKNIIANGRHHDYTVLRNYFDEEYLNNEEYNINKWTDNGLTNSNTQFQSFYMVNTDKTKALGYYQNVTYWWTNERSTNDCVDSLITHGSSDYATAYALRAGSGVEDHTAYAEVHGLKLPIISPQYYQITFYPTENGQTSPSPIAAETNEFGTLGFLIPDLSNYGDISFKVNYLGHTLMYNINDTASSNFNLDKKELNLNNVLFYPNPANEQITAQSQKEISGYELLESDGKMINAQNYQGLNTIVIKTKELERGIYLIKLKLIEGSVVVKQFVKVD